MNKIFETPLYPYSHHADQDEATRAHHPVVIIGAGPVGLCAAIDLAQRGIAVLVIDENDKVSFGSRAICFAKRTLEICDRLGIGDKMIAKGVEWNLGKVFFDDRRVYEFNLLAEEAHRRPAFINLQQYYLEVYLVERIRELQKNGAKIDIRGETHLSEIDQTDTAAQLGLDTPDGIYEITANWVIACDGANSPTRAMLGLDFVGRAFEDNFLIADVTMEADFPTERWFWFDPPFNKGQSALLHKQPDGVWRIDLQLGWDIDKEEEKKPKNVIPRLKAMLGEDVHFDLEWVSIYTFQCRRMEKFLHGRIIFAGDSAHQVSPFGARGANSGIQDIDNLGWKLAEVVCKNAPASLLQTYNDERVFGANENILNSTRSTDFITPKSGMSRLFRDAVLDLSEKYAFARPLVNSGRLSLPARYGASNAFGPDALNGPKASSPGAPCPDAAIGNQTFLLQNLSQGFTLFSINQEPAGQITERGCALTHLSITANADENPFIAKRYLGAQKTAVYLIRPDQHIAARWSEFDETTIRRAIRKSLGYLE